MSSKGSPGVVKDFSNLFIVAELPCLVAIVDCTYVHHVVYCTNTSTPRLVAIVDCTYVHHVVYCTNTSTHRVLLLLLTVPMYGQLQLPLGLVTVARPGSGSSQNEQQN